MNNLLNKLIENLKETFKDRLSSIFIYGSCATNNYSEKISDINLIVIIKDLRAEDLKKAHLFVERFVKKTKSLPIFMDKDEWFSSSDVYSIEYSDIKDRYKLLYGENLIDGLNVEKCNLRFQCEQEVKNLLIRLRQTYLVKASDKNSIKNLIQASSKTFIVMFRTILKLLDEPVPAGHDEVINLFSQKLKTKDFDKQLFLKILEFRTNKKVFRDCDLEGIIQKLIDSTNYMLKYVDKIEV